MAKRPPDGARNAAKAPRHRVSDGRLGVEAFRFTTARGTALLADEAEDAIDPNALGLRLWNHVLLVCTLYEAFILPFFVTFKPNAPRTQPKELYVVVVCEFIFLVDVAVQAHTGYYHDGNIVRDRRKTRVRYLKSRKFLLDVFTLVPFSYLFSVQMVSRAALEMHKLLRWVSLPKYVATLDTMYAKHFVIMKLIKMIVSTVYLAHFVACLRFRFGYNEHHDNEWLPEPPHEPPTVQHQYLSSAFWAFGLLSGLFEGELPTTIPEFLFTLCVAVGGFSLFTALCAMFFMISKCENGNSEAAEARINQLKHLLSFHCVPDHLQKQAIDYLQRYYTDDESNDREVIKLLCPSISKDIQVELMKDTVAKIPLFEGCTDKFITALTSLLELVSLPAQSTVFQVGEHGDSMYIVHSGVFNVIIKGVTVREMRKPMCFGEISVFTDAPRSATIVSATYSTLYKLSRFHSERLLEGYPECAASIAAVIADLVTNGGDKRRSTTVLTSSSSHSRFDFKRIDAAVMKAKLRGRVQAASFFSWGKPSSYVHPGSDTTEAEEMLEKPREADSDGHLEKKDNALKSYYDKKEDVMEEDIATTHFVWLARKILFRRCIDADSRFRAWWILVLQLVLVYNWIIIPLRLCFPVLNRPMWYIDMANIVADLLLLVDIYLNFNLSYTVDSEKIMDTSRSALHYLKRGFLFDVCCVMPFWILSTSEKNFYIRVSRLLRSRSFYHHYLEVSTLWKLTNRSRLAILGFTLVLLYHIIACLHFGISSFEGFSHEEESWIPSEDIFLKQINNTHYLAEHGTILSIDDEELHVIAGKQYFRSLYYATNVLAALGKTIEPESDIQYGIALCFMLSGFLITAIAVDNVQKRFTASAYEQKEFYAMRTRIQLFLRRQNAPVAIFQRVNSFLDFWWSSHRGAFISELLADLPAPVKLEILHSICSPALQTIGLLTGVRPVLDKLENFFVTNASFILYGQGEVVYRQGDYANGLFFLLEGAVCVIANAQNPRSVPRGSFFGTAVLQPKESADGYGEHVSATRGCIVLFVSRSHLLGMEKIFPGLFGELLALETKLLTNKMMKANLRFSAVSHGRSTGSRQSYIAQSTEAKKTWKSKLFGAGASALDPDSIFVILWETWLFLAMTVQWLAVTVQMCFRMKQTRHFQADVMTAVLEVSFFIDVYLRTRIGYYAFGNKIMDPHVIRSSYFRSKTFVIDLLSLTPLYVFNWFRLPANRIDGLNVNKIFRVLKVPNQLNALENRYLRHTTELRLFKLFYYTFLLAHMFGCMWFDFASNASHLLNISGDIGTEFGDDPWLPPAELETAHLNRQYFASIFWSFGLMSASSTGELPKTSHECLFAVVTMTSGFFLFAYVVGNFTDIIELAEGDNREFLQHLSAFRLVKAHFSLPKLISERIKTYYCFKRYHTITQERHLERCLPPSLLTDIRLVHLKPMIDKVSFLSGMEGSVTRMLVSQFSQRLVLRDQFVCKFGDEGFDMYFVFTGVLDVLLPAEMVTAEEESEWEVGRDQDNDRSSAKVASSAQTPEDPQEQKLKKVNELMSGSYFGENGLFTKSLRNAYVRASTSSILYKLSRESLELVFDRYPQWKEKVLRIANLQQEQQRLARLTREEQHRRSDEANGSMLSRIDIINRRAEKLEEELQLVRIRRMDSTLNTKNTQDTEPPETLRAWDRFVVEPCKVVWNDLKCGARAQSRTHRQWLWFMTMCTMYKAFIVPYRIAIDSLDRSTAAASFVKAVEVLCEVMFVADIRVSWKVKECRDSMELYEQNHQLMYRKERLMWDLIAAIPLDRLLSDFTDSPWLHLLRCVKIRNVVGYMNELNRRSVSVELNRFRGVCMIYGLCIYFVGCGYLAISEHEGFGEEWNAWRPSTALELSNEHYPSNEQVMLRMLRGLFFGMTAFIKKGKTFTPDSTALYIFSVLISFTGMLVMSFMIGEFASLYISHIWNEIDFRKNHIAVELYLDRLEVSDELKERTQRFMSSLWSAHSGVDYAAIFSELPSSIKSSAVVHIANRPLRLFMSSTFRMLASDDAKDLDLFTQMIAQELHFEGYPRDENVVSEGGISRAMYVIVRGHLILGSISNPSFPRRILRKGEYFGERGLLGCAVSDVTVRTVRACDLLSLRSESLLKIIQENAFSSLALGLVHRAIVYMSGQQLTGNSRKDMEDQWGEALLHELFKLKAAARGRPSFYSSSTRVSREHVDRLAKSLASPSDCVRAFLPFLNIVLPFDPLDWSATARTAAGAKTTVVDAGTLPTLAAAMNALPASCAVVSMPEVAKAVIPDAEPPREPSMPQVTEEAVATPPDMDVEVTVAATDGVEIEAKEEEIALVVKETDDVAVEAKEEEVVVAYEEVHEPVAPPQLEVQVIPTVDWIAEVTKGEELSQRTETEATLSLHVAVAVTDGVAVEANEGEVALVTSWPAAQPEMVSPVDWIPASPDTPQSVASSNAQDPRSNT